MPRDLEALAKENTLSDMPELTKSPDDIEDERHTPMDDAQDQMPQGSLFSQLVERNDKRDELHPYVQTLNPSDVESCTRLEEEAFPPHERATREKFQYRLQTCGNLSLGIFTSHDPTATANSSEEIPTASTSAPVYSGAPHRKAVLLGHIIATKTTNPVVTDADMAIPPSSPSSSAPSSSDPTNAKTVGHQEAGRTLCLHSLAVLPSYQRRSLGSTLLKAYLQRMQSHNVADRVALIAHEAMVPWYEGFGFENKGRSKAEFGGGGWWDMVRVLGDEEGDESDEYEDDEGKEGLEVGGRVVEVDV